MLKLPSSSRTKYKNEQVIEKLLRKNLTKSAAFAVVSRPKRSISISGSTVTPTSLPIWVNVALYSSITRMNFNDGYCGPLVIRPIIYLWLLWQSQWFKNGSLHWNVVPIIQQPLVLSGLWRLFEWTVQQCDDYCTKWPPFGTSLWTFGSYRETLFRRCDVIDEVIRQELLNVLP